MNGVACRASLTHCVVAYDEIEPCDTACAGAACFLDTQPVGPYDRRVGLQSVKGVAVRATRTFPSLPDSPSAVIGLHSSVPASFISLDY